MKDRQPQPEVKSLVGKIDKASMGQRIIRNKPKKSGSKSGSKSTLSRGNERADLLSERFDETLIYKPRTKENRIVYNNFLGKILSVVEDQPQDILMSIADEILAILKSESKDQDKQSDIKVIIGEKIPHDMFLDMINMARNITDYKIEEDEEQLREGMIIEESGEEDQQSGDSEGVIEEEEQIAEEEAVREHKIQALKRDSKMEQEADPNRVDPNSVDAHWLHSQLSKHYDAIIAQNIERQILTVLNSSTKLEVENNLLSILNYQKFDLIKLFLENRKVIYLCTKFHQSQNEKEKEQLLEEMRENDITIGKKWMGRKEKHSDATKPHAKHETQGQQARQIMDVSMMKEDEINRLSKKILDLTIHDQTSRLTKKQEYKFKLPEGATKLEKPGYEEIMIPARTRQLTETLIQVKSLPEWMHPVFDNIKVFNPIQSKVFDHTINSDKNMLVCAPTSAGKTNVALLSIMQTISQYRLENGVIDTSKFKIVYVAPMKALVAEVTGNLSNRLKDLNINVRELTGDMHLTKGQIEDTQVIVATPEKWDIITRKAGDRLFTEKVRLLIIDEIHLLGDSRGPVLESIIARTIRQVESTQEHVRIVGLSATLPNYLDVGALLRIRSKAGVFYFDQSYRPIPMEQLYVGITEKKGVRKMMMINEILYEKVIERVSQNQMIIFVHSRRDTARTARYLYDTAYGKDEAHNILRPDSQSKKLLETIAEKETINSNQLKELLVKGIGIHHAGLTRADRDLVQQLFADRHLSILVSTATLAWGVNLPAYNVIIKGTQVYSAEEGRWIELSLQDIMQMMGRAGRPRYDVKGEGIIITGYEEVRYYLGLLNMQIALESQMIKTLPDQLNAEIVLGTVNSVKDGVQWLTYTYLFIRMLKNPKYYSISPEEIEEDPQLLKRRVNLIHTAATILQRNGLVNYDRRTGSITSTFMGKIASYYYIKYPSMAVYNSNLKNSSGLIDLFRIFSMSLEFKYVSVREEEKTQLQKLMESVPVPIKGSIDDSNSKISALLQAHISRLRLDGYALSVDKIYVTQSASRIMRALFQISLKRCWGQVAQRALDLAKMIDKSMWSCMNPLRQFKEIPEYVLSRLEKKEQFSWQSFYQMNPQQIGDLTKFPKLGKILHKFVHCVPRLQLDAYAQPITKSCLRVDLTIKLDFRWEEEFHGKEQPFWVMVMDCNEEQILFHDYLVLNKKTETYYMQFIVPLFTVLHPLYFIKVISDRWICSDNILPLSFKNMVLPAEFPAPSELLDLQPHPASSFQLAKDLKITHFNQIQTQVFSSLFNKHEKGQTNSVENVFIGAAQGSGKFTMVMFTFQKHLQEAKKIVIMLSHKELLSRKVSQLSKLFSKNKVGRTYHDVSKDAVVLMTNDIIVTTPEAWDTLSRRWRVRKGFSDIGLFLADNLHLVGEGDSTMEVVVSRMRYISRQIQEENGNVFRIIGLAASIADYQEIAAWISAPAHNTFNFHPSVRQNSVEIVFNSYDQHIRESRLHNMQRSIMQSAKHYGKNCVVFVNDRRQAKLTALDFVSLLSTQANPKRMRKVGDQQMRLVSKKISDQYLNHILDYGIGYIYEGMNEVQRQIVEQLFEIQQINILIVTHGLKWQATCRSFMVCVLDCSFYDCRTSRWLDYSIPEMIQMMSVASVEKDRHKSKELNSSKFQIYCHSAKKNFYKKFLFEPYPVESSLHLNLANHLNSAIVSKSIQNVSDCMSWLSWTFLHRRLLKNPNFYNMQYSISGAEKIQEVESIYLSELIENTVEYLEGTKCVEADEEDMSLAETNLGIICSYYGIKVETMGRFLSKLTIGIKLKEILELICSAEELDMVSYRPKQYQTIGQLLLPFQEKAVNKPHGLLLLYLNRASVPSEFLHESKTILPICVRLLHGLVDIVSSLTYFKPLIMTMQLCQMLIQAMWINESPLLQVMDKTLAGQLQQQGIADVSDFINMSEEDRSKALKGASVNIDKIAYACNRYPIMSLTSEVKEVSQDEITVAVTLSRDEPLENQQIVSGFYPVDKEEMWWVIVGDKKTNRVFSTKRSIVKQQANIQLTFDRDPDVKAYTLYALCDSYVGCDQVEELQLS